MTEIDKRVPKPAGQAGAACAASEWVSLVVDEFRLRASVHAKCVGDVLVQAAQDLRESESALKVGGVRDEHVAHLERVALQLVLWDCDPRRPDKATWLSMAADDFSDAVASFRCEHGHRSQRS